MLIIKFIGSNIGVSNEKIYEIFFEFKKVLWWVCNISRLIKFNNHLLCFYKKKDNPKILDLFQFITNKVFDTKK